MRGERQHQKVEIGASSPILTRSLWSLRQYKPHHTTPCRGTVHRKLPRHGAGQTMCKHQPQATIRQILSICSPRREQIGTLRLRNPWTGIPDLDHDMPASRTAAQQHASGRRDLHSMRKQAAQRSG